MTILVGSNVTTDYTDPLNYGGATGRCYARSFSASASGNATLLYIYASDITLSTSGIKLCLWNSGGTLLAATAEITAGSGWVSSGISSTAITSGQNYYLGFILADDLYTQMNSNAVSNAIDEGTNNYATPTNLSGMGQSAKEQYLMYADGTASGGQSNAPRVQIYNTFVGG